MQRLENCFFYASRYTFSLQNFCSDLVQYHISGQECNKFYTDRLYKQFTPSIYLIQILNNNKRTLKNNRFKTNPPFFFYFVFENESPAFEDWNNFKADRPFTIFAKKKFSAKLRY